jgi:hypothetical protein
MDHKDFLSRADRRAFWIAAVDLWRSSGLSMAEFCRREKLSDKTFWAWRKRVESQAADSGGSLACAQDAPPSGRALFQRLHIVPESVSGMPEACGTGDPSGPTPVAMEIVVAGRRRIVLHGDALAPVRRTASPGRSALAEVVRILESVPLTPEVPVASGSDALWQEEGHRC